MVIATCLPYKQYNFTLAANKKLYHQHLLLQRVKIELYPRNDIVAENMSEVKLQNILDHTTKTLGK